MNIAADAPSRNGHTPIQSSRAEVFAPASRTMVARSRSVMKNRLTLPVHHVGARAVRQQRAEPARVWNTEKGGGAARHSSGHQVLTFITYG
jgi:hypothetical protein